MKIIITGDGTFSNYPLLKSISEDLILKHWKDPIELIITRGRKGAEALAEQLAAELSIPVKQFLPDTDTYGDDALTIANVQMVDEANAILIFWDGVSNSTSHTLDLARKKDILIEVIDYSKA